MTQGQRVAPGTTHPLRRVSWTPNTNPPPETRRAKPHDRKPGEQSPMTPNPANEARQMKPRNPKPGKRSPTKPNPANKAPQSQTWQTKPHEAKPREQNCETGSPMLQPAPMPVRPQSPNLANKTTVNNDPTNRMLADEYHVRTTPTAAGVIV
ncbi:hypothetical protein BS47DRAFT_1365654 [Hydnum rufescens UP504]|uniref:Uncharacterized protein n=1 Tax=Hydnum rufescens UP504 TaxID=1448309 RepID=A0A9P6ANH8_9AGAM|nr:hypothetical protein BS47DRAFT_1365654 [Hydnum rufescens UP504]